MKDFGDFLDVVHSIHIVEGDLVYAITISCVCRVSMPLATIHEVFQNVEYIRNPSLCELCASFSDSFSRLYDFVKVDHHPTFEVLK